MTPCVGPVIVVCQPVISNVPLASIPSPLELMYSVPPETTMLPFEFPEPNGSPFGPRPPN